MELLELILVGFMELLESIIFGLALIAIILIGFAIGVIVSQMDNCFDDEDDWRYKDQKK